MTVAAFFACLKFILGAWMSRSLIVVISALLGLAGFGFGAGNPVDIVADVE